MSPYDLITLLQVLAVQKTIPLFWGRWFPRELTFETESIAFDRVSQNYKRLAPFVAPNVQGRIMKKQGYSTVSFKPAYVKPKSAIDPNTDLTRQPGEVLLTGSLSLAQRRNAMVAQLLGEHRISIDNRVEWMMCRAIVDGAVTISGEDYPTTTVNFGRDASLSATLAGGAKWDQVATRNPMGDLKSMRQAAKTVSGAVIRDFVFGSTAWDNFYAALDKDLLTTTIRGSATEVSPILDGFDGVEFAGTIAGFSGQGQMRCWVYSAKYEDEAGTQFDMLDPNTVVGVSDVIQGVRCYGAIKDLDAGPQALVYFPKVYRKDDPSVEYLLTQSAPLPVPANPNGSFSIKTA